MDNRFLIVLAVIAFVFYALHKSQSMKPPGSGEDSGGSMEKTTRPVTPEIVPISRPGGGSTIVNDPVGSYGNFHSGITNPVIEKRISRTLERR